jgi:hypothetical protein
VRGSGGRCLCFRRRRRDLGLCGGVRLGPAVRRLVALGVTRLRLVAVRLLRLRVVVATAEQQRCLGVGGGMVELRLRGRRRYGSGLFGGGRRGDARRRGGGLGRAALGVLVDRVQHGEAGRGGRRLGRCVLLGCGGRRRGRGVLLGRSEAPRGVLARRGCTGSSLLGVAVPAGRRRGGGARRGLLLRKSVAARALSRSGLCRLSGLRGLCGLLRCGLGGRLCRCGGGRCGTLRRDAWRPRGRSDGRAARRGRRGPPGVLLTAGRGAALRALGVPGGRFVDDFELAGEIHLVIVPVRGRAAAVVLGPIPVHCLPPGQPLLLSWSSSRPCGPSGESHAAAIVTAPPEA